jgi:fermentation-respiration switch protein FrsA (DUF1100 family)
MKVFLTFCLSLFAMLTTLGQNITGQWNGALNIQGMQLRLVFHIEQTDDGYQSTMDSPDQGATGIPVAETTFADSTLNISAPNLGLTYEGKWDGEKISGTFRQSGLEMPLELTREEVEEQVLNRPQEPQPPFPYHVEEVTFANAEAGIELAGTLTLPKKKGKFPAVILVSGSGPQNRDEELLGHKPFLVLADFLTRNGIAVLRYDDRGVGESGGDFSTATSEDLASDAASAVAYLRSRKEFKKQEVGIMGHSEGGLIAPMVAVESDELDFIVLLAGPGLDGGDIIVKQSALIARAEGASEEEVAVSSTINQDIMDLTRKAKDTASLSQEITEYLRKAIAENPVIEEQAGEDPEGFINIILQRMVNPWMLYFVQYDPAPTLEKVEIPTLALIGEKDLQVPAQANLAAIEAAFARGGHADQLTAKELPGLNHLFQECETGAPSEYSVIEQTFAPAALEEILNWIRQQVR